MAAQKNLQVPWLPAPVWKDFPLTKGLGHHRTPVGIILAANEELTCSLESEGLDEVQVRLINNDSDAEAKFVIKSSFPGRAGVFGIDAVSVPFIDCEYLDEPPTLSRSVSVSYPFDSKVLPIYRFGDNEDDFFQLWDAEDAEFAYIESDYFGLLIPSIDKEAARQLPNGNHLDDLINFYNEIFTIYSDLIGLSFEETDINLNVRNRFFIKADKNGAGAAYYCDWCTAETSPSIKSFWLDISPTNWGVLHEIGHGHDLKCLSDETLSVNEVWNNILVVFYQTIMFGNDAETKCTKHEEMKIHEPLESIVPVKEWGLFHKLSFLMHMFLKAGQKSFTSFNQFIRQELGGHFNYASGAAFLEKLMHFFAVDYGIDMHPFMKLARAEIAREHLIDHYYILASVAYPLNYLISDIEEVNLFKNQFGLWFETSLVTPLDLRPTKLKNNFTVKIDHRSFDDLFGDMIKLMDGSRTVVEKRILNETIIFTNIPIGVYKIFISPSSFNTKLVYNNFYAIVHASKTNELFLSAEVMKAPSILHDKIKFFGLGDTHFATLSVDPLNYLVRFHVFSCEPHSYYKDDKYVSVEIKNQENAVILSKTLQGDNCVVGLHEIHMEGPLQIEIFHAETKERLKTDDPIMDEIIDHESNTNYLLVNELGFHKKNTPKELLEKRMLNRIELIANKIRKRTSLHNRRRCQPKYSLLLAVETFEHLFRKDCICPKLREKYKDCLPPEHCSQLLDALVNLNRIPNLKISSDKYYCNLINSTTGRRIVLPSSHSSISTSTITFLGFNDKLVAKLYIDTKDCAVNFLVLDSNPHYRFEDETYIEIVIRDKENKILFSLSLEGSEATEEEYKILFTNLVEIDIFHAEPGRLQLESTAMEDIIDRKSSASTLILTKEYFNVNYSYELVQTDTGEKLSLPNDEMAIPYSRLNFLGLSDKHAASLYIDTQNTNIYFNVIAIDPHSRFEGEPYFGVKILNSKKEILFSKLVEGLHPVTEEFKIPFVERVELEVFHAEPFRLTANNLAMRDLIDRKSNTNTFFISREISNEYYLYEMANAASNKRVELPSESNLSPVSLVKYRGESDKHVATLYWDISNDRILFNVLSPEPHCRFENEVYMGITIRNEEGEVLFSKEITGVDDLQQNFVIRIKGNIEVDVFHAEPDRLVSDNVEIESLIDHENSRNTFVIKKSLNFHKMRKNRHKSKHSSKILKRRKSI